MNYVWKGSTLKPKFKRYVSRYFRNGLELTGFSRPYKGYTIATRGVLRLRYESQIAGEPVYFTPYFLRFAAFSAPRSRFRGR